MDGGALCRGCCCRHVYLNPRQDGFLRAQGEEAFTYSVRGTDATITGYTGEDRDVVVPEQIDGMTVVAIGGRAFYGDAIRSITLRIPCRALAKRVCGLYVDHLRCSCLHNCRP